MWVGRDGQLLQSDFGIIQGKSVTNNVMELMAAVVALQSVDIGWAGTIFTDSMCTLYRLKRGGRVPKLKGVPNRLRAATLELRRSGRYEIEWVKGHANDQYNNYVDYLCELAIKNRPCATSLFISQSD